MKNPNKCAILMVVNFLRIEGLKMKNVYESPVVEIVVLSSEDVVVTSYLPGPDEGEPDILF